MDMLPPIALGFFGSLATGLLTAAGAVPVLFGRIPARPTRDLLLGFAAGVMLAASFFSLIIPALDAATELYGDGAIPAGIVVVAILLGMGAVALIIGGILSGSLRALRVLARVRNRSRRFSVTVK